MSTAIEGQRASARQAAVRHADLLEAAARAVEATRGKDSGILRLLAVRARDAAAALWEIESEGHFPDWTRTEKGLRVYRALYSLPVLAIAARAVADDPTAEPEEEYHGDRGIWCEHVASDVADDLRAWIKAGEAAHEEAGAA